jgi:hypothetical protein
MVLSRPLADHQRLTDLAIASPLSDERGDLPLTRTQDPRISFW